MQLPHPRLQVSHDVVRRQLPPTTPSRLLQTRYDGVFVRQLLLQVVHLHTVRRYQRGEVVCFSLALAVTDRINVGDATGPTVSPRRHAATTTATTTMTPPVISRDHSVATTTTAATAATTATATVPDAVCTPQGSAQVQR